MCVCVYNRYNGYVFVCLCIPFNIKSTHTLNQMIIMIHTYTYVNFDTTPLLRR